MVMALFLGGCSLEELERIVTTTTKQIQSPIVEGEAMIAFLDVGQGDSTLIQSEQVTILIDTGRHDSELIFSRLEEFNVDSIDLLVLTHPHADHIGNADRVIEQYEPNEVWIDGNEATSRTFERLIDVLLESEVTVNEPRAGESYEVGDILIDVLSPFELTGNLNDDSISMRITYGDVRLLTTGDAERRSEMKMLESGSDLAADIYKVGHHGSSTSNTKEFVQAISPEVAIYSAGKDNQYGHPHREVIALTEQLGIDMYGTSEHGTVIIATDGETFELSYK
ncbi:hypothetical protein AB990_10175 [Alkalihalobacillus pseudalcaliphilus]|nr:hypothetical protein AB990_10175 [Alkalihalobacillus pseudalcaliphilus]